jgi:hypothetical protein
VFVAMTLHLREIIEHPVHRHRARTILTGFTAVFIRCGLVLMGGQNRQAVAAELLLVVAAVEVVLLRSIKEAAPAASTGVPSQACCHELGSRSGSAPGGISRRQDAATPHRVGGWAGRPALHPRQPGMDERRGSPPGSTWRWPWSPTTWASTSHRRWPGGYSCSCTGQAGRGGCLRECRRPTCRRRNDGTGSGPPHSVPRRDRTIPARPR